MVKILENIKRLASSFATTGAPLEPAIVAARRTGPFPWLSYSISPKSTQRPAFDYLDRYCLHADLCVLLLEVWGESYAARIHSDNDILGISPLSINTNLGGSNKNAMCCIMCRSFELLP